MFDASVRWLTLASAIGLTTLACSDDASNPPGATAGTGGSVAGTSPQGGSSSGSGGSSSTAGNGAGGMSGNGGSSGGSAGSGGQSGSGGSASGGGGSGGSAGSGGGASEPTAIATIAGVGPGVGKVAGTATFTQGATMTKLVLSLTMCPDGAHASHLHQTKDCGNDGNAAGNHWVPNGENLGNYTCAAGKGSLEVSKPLSVWTVGGSADTDVTKHSFMVHEAGDPSPGGRIGCGPVDVK